MGKRSTKGRTSSLPDRGPISGVQKRMMDIADSESREGDLDDSDSCDSENPSPAQTSKKSVWYIYMVFSISRCHPSRLKMMLCQQLWQQAAQHTVIPHYTTRLLSLRMLNCI